MEVMQRLLRSFRWELLVDLWLVGLKRAGARSVSFRIGSPVP